MVLLYLGTLFMVIGYHNNWVSFMKFLGLAMVILGILCVGSAIGKSFSLMFEARVRDYSDYAYYHITHACQILRTMAHQADPSLNLPHGTDRMDTAHDRLKARRVSPTMKKRSIWICQTMTRPNLSGKYSKPMKW